MKPRRKAPWLMVGAVAMAGSVVLAGCGGDDSASSTNDSGTATKGGTYRLAMTDLGYTSGFDPTAEYTAVGWNTMKNLLLRGLVGNRGTSGVAGNEPVADLATAVPEPTDGGLTWTFTLKKGVKFGPPVDRAVTSKDVAYAFQRLGTPSVAAGYAFYYSVIKGFDDFAAGKAKTISGIETPDDQTIVFHLTKPTGDFPQRLSLPAAAPIPPEVGKCFTGASEYGRYVISSGPYMIKGSDALNISSCSTMKPISGFNPAKGMTLVRNPNYDQATDDLRENNPDTFQLIVNTNSKDIFDKIAAGEYEDSYEAVPADVAAKYSRDDALKDRLKSYTDDGVNMVVMSMNEAPFDDVHVRKAVNWVMDRSGLQRAWGGETYGSLTGHIIPNALLGDSPDIVDYDPFATTDSAGDVEKAKAEMKQSKYDTNKDGLCDAGACKGVLFVNRNITPFTKLTPIIQSSLTKLGIAIQVRELPSGPAYETTNTLASRVPVFANARWGKDYADATTYAVLFDGNNILATNNSVWGLTGLTAAQAKKFKIPYPAGGVPSVNADIAKCNGSSGDERIACWVALDKKLTEEVVPWVPYMHSRNTDLLSPAVTKWDFDQATGEAALAHVAVDPSKQK